MMRRAAWFCPLLMLGCLATRAVPSYPAGFAPPGLESLAPGRTPIAAPLPDRDDLEPDGERGPQPILREPQRAEGEADLSQPVIPGERTYTVNFSGLELGHAIQLLADEGRINMVVPLELSRPVAASFPSVTLDQALKSLIEHNNLRLIEEEGIYHVLQDSAPGTKTQVYELRSVDPSAIEQELRGVVGAGGTVVVNPATDTVMITAPIDALQRAEQYLQAVDVPEKQVLIHARILEITLNDGFEMGTLWNVEPLRIDNMTARLVSDLLSPSDSVTLGIQHSKSTLESALRVLRDITHIHTLANPNLLALDGGTAKIEIREEIPYIGTINNVETNTGSAGTSSLQQIEFKPVGVTLEIKPTIQRDGRVTVDLTGKVSEVTRFLEGVPATNNRDLNNRFAAVDGNTIVIGGLIKEREREQRTGIPILMDLPLVGPLFQRTATTVERVNLVIFMTPIIIEPGDERARDLAGEYKAVWHRHAQEWGFGMADRLPDVK